jgi:hypothetical protein
VACTVDFKLRLRDLPLAPVLLPNKRAIARDLGYLKTDRAGLASWDRRLLGESR